MAQSTFLWIALAFSKNSRTFAPQMQMSRKVSGQIPEWPNGADCKSAVFRLRWFESIFAHRNGERCSPFLLFHLPYTSKIK